MWSTRNIVEMKIKFLQLYFVSGDADDTESRTSKVNSQI